VIGENKTPMRLFHKIDMTRMFDKVEAIF